MQLFPPHTTHCTEGYAYNMHSIIFYIQCQVYAVFSPDCFDLVLCSTQRLMAHQALYYTCALLYNNMCHKQFHIPVSCAPVAVWCSG